MSTFPSATFSPTDEWENTGKITGKKFRKRERRKTDFQLNEDRDIYLIIFSLPLPGKHQTYKTEQRSYYTNNSWNVTDRNIFFYILYMRPLPGANFPALGNGCRFFAPFLACVWQALIAEGEGGTRAREEREIVSACNDALSSCSLFTLLARPNSRLPFPYKRLPRRSVQFPARWAKRDGL